MTSMASLTVGIFRKPPSKLIPCFRGGVFRQMVSRFIRRTNFEQMVSLSTKPAFAVFPIYNLIFPLSLSNKFIYFVCQRKKYKKLYIYHG